MRTLEDRTLLLLVIAVSLTFAWILWPFFNAVLWATVLRSCETNVCFWHKAEVRRLRVIRPLESGHP